MFDRALIVKLGYSAAVTNLPKERYKAEVEKLEGEQRCPCSARKQSRRVRFDHS